MKKHQNGFTLIEMVITITIVVVLSMVSVPIYKNYVSEAKLAEAYTLLGAIKDAQLAYYNKYENFLFCMNGGNWTSFDPVLGIDARGNKYFTRFNVCYATETKISYYFCAMLELLWDSGIWNGKSGHPNWLGLAYNVTRGSRFVNTNEDTSWYDIFS
ncbi:MAG: prepilin-type N-terminal cleavage/methylation domain-containing protein [Elusimicrobia bacterium]|nr:prepilin-type N-terminal cleavage/methylation domain-containing protein [Elusimicrobiota bacterium]